MLTCIVPGYKVFHIKIELVCGAASHPIAYCKYLRLPNTFGPLVELNKELKRVVHNFSSANIFAKCLPRLRK